MSKEPMTPQDFQVIDSLLSHQSEMGDRVRSFDWSSTSLGTPSTWPLTLQAALGICLNSKFPMFVRWGPDLIHFYNDAYAPILGQKHPEALGRPAREVWSEIWPEIEDQIQAVMRDGQASWNERVPLKLERNGFVEDTWITWSYSPIPDGQGGIGGLFCACTEETANVLAANERTMLMEQRGFALRSAQLGWWQLDLTTQEVFWDERFKVIFGVDRDGLCFDEIMESIHVDDRDMVRAAVQVSVDPDNPRPYTMEARVVHSDGQICWVYSQGEVHLGVGGRGPSLVGTVSDITERKRNEDALQERIRLAELSADIGRALTIKGDDLPTMLGQCADAMVEHLGAAFARIWTLDNSGTALELQASAGFYTHLNGPHSRVPIGRFKIGMIAQQREPHLTNEVWKDQSVSDQEWAKREGMVAFAGYPLIVEDKLLGVAAIFARQPLTQATFDALASVSNAVALGIERKRGEEERARLLEKEREARQQAEVTNRIKDEFLSTLSHELRTPLQAIIGWSHLMRTGQLDASETQLAVETIDRNANAQVQLVEDLLDVSRIITGKLRLEVQPTELSAVIKAATNAVRPAAQAKNIRLQVLLDPDAGPIFGDANRLQQIVWNLLSNAVKFTPKEGRVQIRLERVHSHVEITVSDSGQGIAPEFLPYIFDRFRQADQTTTRGYGGLGLGLSIAHQLVELHGGSIEVHSLGLGQGSTFMVNLPSMALLPQPSGEEEELRRHPTAVSSPPSDDAFDCPPQLSHVRVLLVDDESDSRTILRMVLENCDARVTTAASVDEAFAAFQEQRPDILISDIGMPGQDGYALIKKIREWEAITGGRTPAVALTAYARVEDRVRALRAGFQVHVPKPVEPAELLAVVVSLAGNAPADA